MKRSSSFLPPFAASLCLSILLGSISGCLSMPRFSTGATSAAITSAGPPVWDDESPAAFADEIGELASSQPPSDQADAAVPDDSESDSVTVDGAPGQQQPSSKRIANRGPVPKLVDTPKPFAWKVEARSSGDREIQSIVIGQGGYRVLLIGSLAGNDKVAVQFTERLATHLHNNQIVLGGIELTVIRNLNPDGEASDQSETDQGRYLNRQLPKSTDEVPDRASFPVELQYLLSKIDSRQPQRVIHVRTIGLEQGVVACSPGAKDVAADVSGWLDFQLIELPGRSVPGTLERYLSESETCDIVTFAMPDKVSSEEAWELYSDALLNLLMDEDFATRKLVRQQKSSKAADSRGRKD